MAKDDGRPTREGTVTNVQVCATDPCCCHSDQDLVWAGDRYRDVTEFEVAGTAGSLDQCSHVHGASTE